MNTTPSDCGQLFLEPPDVDVTEQRQWVADGGEETMRQLRNPFRAEPTAVQRPTDPHQA